MIDEDAISVEIKDTKGLRKQLVSRPRFIRITKAMFERCIVKHKKGKEVLHTYYPY